MAGSPAAVLILSTSAMAENIAAELHASTGQSARLATDVRALLCELRKNSFKIVVVDESLMDIDESRVIMLVERYGPAVPMFVNFAISRPERVLQEIRLALSRAQQEHDAATMIAKEEVRAQLTSNLTAISQTAAQLLQTEIPEAAKDKVRRISEIMDNIQAQFRVA